MPKAFQAGFARAAILLLSALLLASCADTNTQNQLWVSQDQCNGQPNWCVRISNEADSDMDIYLDGSVYGSVSGDRTVYLPVAAGQPYTINACYEITQGLLQIPVRKVCMEGHTFVAQQNRPYILYPVQ